MNGEQRRKWRNHVVYCKVISQPYSDRNDDCHKKYNVSRNNLRCDVLKSMRIKLISFDL